MSPDSPRLSVRLRTLWIQRNDMLAGLTDAGFSSLATFAVGIYAVRALEPTVLGGYALAYQAIFLVGIVPANLVFVPVEIAVVERLPKNRLGYLGRSLRIGAVPTLLFGLVAALWLPIAPPEVPARAAWALATTGAATAVLSPVQDHVRRMLHTGGRSWLAASVSAVQLATAVGALYALDARGLDPAGIPFGALALANLLSLAVGVFAAALAPHERDGLELRFAELARGGRWLVGGGLLNPATGFVSAAVVSWLAGAAALGYAEAARVVAQPVWVLAVGLSSVLGPRSMQAARRVRHDQARAVRRMFLGSVLALGALDLAWFGWGWRLNPLAWLLPAAYAVSGLVAVSILAQVLGATIFPYRSELLGARRESTYTRVEVTGSVVRTAIAASAVAIHAFAIPLGHIASWAVRWVGFRRALGRVYSGSGAGLPPGGSTETVRSRLS